MAAELGLGRFNHRRPTTLRSHLTALVLATMLPLLIFSGLMIYLLTERERATFERGATERTRAVVTAVDTELKNSITTLEALAALSHFDSDDLQGFREEAARVLKSQSNWLAINLAVPSGQQVVNLLRSSDAELSVTRERASFDEALRTGKPSVGNMVQDPVTHRQQFSVHVPVMRNRVKKYVLSAIIKPETIVSLIVAQGLPSEWIGVILDANRRFVARTISPERNLGQPASSSLQAALDRASEGWFSGTTIEGWNVYTAYHRSTFSGWTVAISVPAHIVDTPLRGPVLYVTLFGVGLLGLGIALAWWLSSQTAGSIQSLTKLVQNLGLGKDTAAVPANVVPNDISEIQEVRSALLTAGRLIQERSDERDRTEAAVQQVRERLELAQETASIGVFERNLVTNEITWSASQEKLYGITPGSSGGKREDWAKRVHPDDLAAVEAAVRHSAETLTPYRSAFRIIRPDGSLRWIASQARIFADEKGRPCRMLGVNVDITERKRAEQFIQLQIVASRALTESDELSDVTPKIIEAICELTGWEVGAIWDVDRSANELACVNVWHVPIVNVPEFEAATRQLRVSPGVGLTGRVWDSGQAAWLADLTKDSNFLRAPQALKAGLHAGVCFPIKVGTEVLGVVECFSREIRESDEECLQALATIGNQLGQFIERKRVEEALRESEERLRLAQSSANVGVWDWYPATGIENFSPEIDRIYGLAPGTIKTHEDWLKRVYPDDIARLEAERNQAIAERKQFDQEFRILHSSGEIRWIYARGGAIYGHEGNVVRVLGVNIDITERKRAEQALKRFNEELERRVAQRTSELQETNAALLRDMEARQKLEEQLLQAQKMESIGTLAGGIAHDFNNILNIIQGHAFNLSDCGVQNEEIGGSLTVINESVQRGSALVQQLLTLARKSGAKLELVNANALIEGLIALIRQTFPRTIELSFASETDLPPIMADRNQIEQTLLNLCVNARDAMPDGGKLMFKTQTVDDASLRHLVEAEGRYVSIEVSDTGTGMDETVRKRIFEPFFTTKSSDQGTGLGLSVVYGIMRNHNGLIDVESKPMSGTTFRLYFPIAPAEMTGKEAVAQFDAQATASPSRAATILVVEDEKSMLDLLERILQRRGYNVLMASDGETAIETYKRRKEVIDVVLLDMGLPKRAGRDVLHQIRNENPNVKVIIASGYFEEEFRAGIDWDGVKFLRKPYVPDVMFETLQSLIE